VQSQFEIWDDYLCDEVLTAQYPAERRSSTAGLSNFGKFLLLMFDCLTVVTHIGLIRIAENGIGVERLARIVG
jgi:hypothetical protein